MTEDTTGGESGSGQQCPECGATGQAVRCGQCGLDL
jgi:hypothetical protein